MMLRANNGYLDFDDSIEVERQIKLFEEISTTDGDYSYQFTAPATSNNLSILGYPFPDNNSKLVYTKIPSQILSDDGLIIHDGFLRIERITNIIYLAFFSGNNNWFGLLSGPLTDVDFSDLDVDQTLSNLIVYDSASTGIVFPVVDTGTLVTRGYRHMKIEDFVAAIYVKTVFKRIFQYHSIKIQGDLLNDVTFNSITTIRNGKSQEQIDANSSYVEKSTTTARPGENVQYKMTFQNDTVYPYYDGANNPFDLVNSRYTAPVKMSVEIEAAFVPSVVDASYNNRIYIYINGAYPGFVDIGLNAGGLYNSSTAGDISPFVLKRVIDIEAGDTVELYAEWQQSTGATQNDVLSGWAKITPKFIYKAFGNSVVPNWTQQEYVSNILRLFNVITYYNPVTKTLTFNLFDKIKSKPPIDLSDHISTVDVDYIDFISNYGKRNLLSYKQVDFDELRDYNIQNFFAYGQGVINADNDFLPDSEDIIESDFSHPQSYINPVFDMSMERLNLISLETGDSTEITSVVTSTWARFNIADDKFLDGDLIRISDCTNPTYNGDWVIETVATGYVELYGLPFDTDATGTITKLEHKYNESDDVYLLWHVPFIQVSNFSGFSNIRWENSNRTEVSLGYFNLLQTGRQINEDFKQSLSFGAIESPLFYQRTLVQTYWQVFDRIVNDPVKLFSLANIPYSLYLTIDFLRPITIKSLETSNQYYLNRMTGYEGSEIDCTLELIKLP